MKRRIGFGLDRDGFFPVLLEGERAVVRLASELSCDVAMVKGIAWGEHEGISVEVVRVDALTRLLGLPPTPRAD